MVSAARVTNLVAIDAPAKIDLDATATADEVAVANDGDAAAVVTDVANRHTKDIRLHAPEQPPAANKMLQYVDITCEAHAAITSTVTFITQRYATTGGQADANIPTKLAGDFTLTLSN